MKHGKIFLGLLILVIASCYLPQNPGQLDGTEQGLDLSVLTDSARGQGVYVNEKGESFDILSEEGPDGKIVKCVEAEGIVRVGSSGEAGSKSLASRGQVKALIFGRRHDGYPGVWEVLNDDTITPVASNDSGEKNSKAGDSCELDWLIHGFFGWQYHIVFPFLGPDTEEGYIMVGYAENARGVDFGGNWEIEEGETVAVYWRLEKKVNGHFHLSRARIIGEPNEHYGEWNKEKDKDFPHHWRYRNSMFVHFFLYLFDSVKFFFLDSFDTYLVDVLEAEYDPGQDKYLVKGHVEGDSGTVTPVIKDGISISFVEKKNKLPVGVATIDPYGEISITTDDGSGSNGGGGVVYDLIVIEAYSPAGFVGEIFVDVSLMDSATNEVAGDEDPDDSKRIVMSDLPGGTYYIRVTSTKAGDQAYALRVLALADGETEPAAIVPEAVNWTDAATVDTSYEPDDTDPDRNPILVGNDNYVNRYLDVDPDGDVDWLRLDL